jgi:hypothetical protein
VPVPRTLRPDHVDGEGDGRAERGQDADRVQGTRVIGTHHQEATRGGQENGAPEAGRQAAPVDNAKPDQEQQRREVLDRHRRADVEALDRREVARVDSGQAGDAEEGERRQLVALHPQEVRARGPEHHQQDQPRAERAHLGQLERTDAVVQQVARHAAVECPQRGRGGRERVATRRVALALPRHR